MLDRLKNNLENRHRFAFSQLDLAFETLWCKRRKSNDSQSSLSSRNRVFKHGVQLFRLETDIIELIRSLRMLKTLSKILLSNYQIWLLSLENSNLLYDKHQNKSKFLKYASQGDKILVSRNRSKKSENLKPYK